MSDYFYFILLFVIVSFGLVSCSKPNQDDVNKLNFIKEKYEDEFRVKLSKDGIYFDLKAKDDTTPSEMVVKKIYKEFFCTSTCLEHRNTSFIYLNLFDSSGNFLYQLMYRKSTKDFLIERKQPYY